MLRLGCRDQQNIHFVFPLLPHPVAFLLCCIQCAPEQFFASLVNVLTPPLGFFFQAFVQTFFSDVDVVRHGLLAEAYGNQRFERVTRDGNTLLELSCQAISTKAETGTEPVASRLTARASERAVGAARRPPAGLGRVGLCTGCAAAPEIPCGQGMDQQSHACAVAGVNLWVTGDWDPARIDLGPASHAERIEKTMELPGDKSYWLVARYD